MQRLLAGEDDELTRDCFGLFCSLMRLSYNDKHLELVSWAEEVAHLSREQQRAFLRHAARLLRETDLPVMEVGFSVGFDNFSYFIKRFRSVYGVSPSHYRKG